VPSPAETDDAIVLRSVDYGEADRIITLLTRRRGRVSALARSARKSKRRFPGALEGFAWISVELSFGRGSLATLHTARVTRSFPRLLGDLTRLNTAGALLRLARDLVPEDVAEEETFDAVAEMLQALNEGDVPCAPYEVAFRARFLALCGVAPLLAACGGCGKVPAEGKIAGFDARRGCLVCRACGGGSTRVAAKVRRLLMRAIDGEVEAVAREGWTAGELREALQLLEEFVEHRVQR
jgi:DNA repair protein RecO (recombination protein O)